MELVLNEEQKILKQAAHSFLAKECPKSLVRQMEVDPRGYSEPMWKEMARLGWLGIFLPEQYGGGGGGFFETALICEELGYAACPSPFMSTVALAGSLIAEAGSEAQKKRLLPAIADGKVQVSLALLEPPDPRWDAGGISAVAKQSAAGFVLNATKISVPNAHVAQSLIVVARTREDAAAEQSLSLFLVGAGETGVQQTKLDTTGGDKLFEVTFKDVRIDQERLIGQVHAGWPALAPILDKAAALKACEIVGACHAVLDITLAYAKQRIQFGRPIGSFQAVHHHFANMFRDIELARRLAYQAAWRLDAGVEASKEVSLAKAKASRIAGDVVELAHRIHGGVGYFAEYDLELYTRRLVGAVSAFGDERYHNERIAGCLEKLAPSFGGHVY